MNRWFKFKPVVGSSATAAQFFKFRQLSQVSLKFFKFDLFSISTNSLKLPNFKNWNLDYIPYRGEVGSSWEDIKEADYGSEEADVIPEIQNNGN